MDKRTLAYNLLLAGLLFVAAVHTAVALFYGTGLADVGVLVVGVVLVGFALVNL